MAQKTGRRIEVRGTVQGVGFRPWVYRLAREARVSGCVRNDASGVTIDAFGTADELRSFCTALAGPPPPAAAIQQLFQCIRSRLFWVPVEILLEQRQDVVVPDDA